jgi:hypothetical protein
MANVSSHYIRQTVAQAGSHFFDRSTMRFFDSATARFGWQYGNVTSETGGYFVLVTSERFDVNYPRLYTVRVFHVTDYGRKVDHEDVGGFQAYASSQAAQAAARRVFVHLCVHGVPGDKTLEAV